MNKVIVTGYIYNRPYENQMKNGGMYLSGSIATRSGFKDADGRTHVDFIPFKAYGKQADYISHFWNKESRVEAEGCIRVMSTESEGKKGRAIYMNVDRITILRPAEDAEKNFSGQTDIDTATPRNTPPSTPSDIMDDDLPF